MRLFLTRFCVCAYAFVILWLASCRPAAQQAAGSHDYTPGRDEFSVMTYNVHQYGFLDRDGGGQKDDPKPRQERDAVVAVIAEAAPDVLAIQEMGAPEVFEEFQQVLETAGLSYEHVEYLRRGRHENNMVVLSRFPIVSRQSHVDDVYSIGEAKPYVARGFIDIDIQVNAAYRFKLMTAHLKSKVFSRLGQTEMRRNEARLLNKHVRRALEADPHLNLLVVGDMNDAYQSAALREVIGKRKRYLYDLRPRDYFGDVWTRFSKEMDEYNRIDYMFVSEAMMPEVVREKTRAVRNSQSYAASDHRPLIAVFKAVDKAPGDAP